MEKIWIKLTRAIPKQPDWKVGDIVQTERSLGQTYVDLGFAQEATEPVENVLDAETQAEIAQMRSAFAETIQLINTHVRATNDALRPTIRIEGGLSEEDKLVPTGGFRSMGHYAFALVRGLKPDSPDPMFRAEMDRYQKAVVAVLTRAPSGMNEASDPDGALPIPPTFSTQIWERTRDYYNVWDQISAIPIAGNTWQMPADAETSRADGQRRGGIQGFWEGEANQYSKSKPTFSDRYLRLKKLTVLVYATNEVLDDAPGLEGYINRVAPEEITFKMNDALVNGTGSGMPWGLLKHPSLVAVAKTTGQGAATLIGQNFLNMIPRLYAPSWKRAVWLVNQDTLGQIQGLSLPTGQYSGQLIYMPPTGLSESPYGTLNGRPVIPIEQCQTVGTQGDVILTDLTQILGIRKASGLQQSMSIHLRFDYDETVFKFTMRIDAQPAWEKALTPFKGTNTQSPIIVCATRS